jgi:hypothetical protein
MPFLGNGDFPPSKGGKAVDVHVSVFLDRLLDIDDRTYDYEVGDAHGCVHARASARSSACGCRGSRLDTQNSTHAPRGGAEHQYQATSVCGSVA